MTFSRLVVLSGPLCAGKSTLAAAIHAISGASVVQARAIIRERAERPTREGLQAAGTALDAATGGAWLAFTVAAIPGPGLIVVDSVRTRRQIVALRDLPTFTTFHVGVSAPRDMRELRFAARSDDLDAGLSFAEAVENELGAEIEALAHLADYRIDTATITAMSAAAAVLAYVHERS